MSEARDYPRIPREVTVEVIKLAYPMDAKGGESVFSVNIAQNGICFLSETKYDLGDILNLRIDLKGLRRFVKNVPSLLDDSLVKAPLSVIAKVAWVKVSDTKNMFEVGVSFEDVDGVEHKALISYLNSLSTATS